MPYYNFPKRPSILSVRQKLIRKLDDIFSEYVRLRDADENGIVTCITCTDTYHWTEVDCGHYVLRGNMSVRWNLQNANGQCRLCNSTHDGRQDEHGAAIDIKYGHGTADKLQKLGLETVHFSEHELESMYQELKKEVKALKEEKFNTAK